jgi:hypothetical protein
MRSGYNITPPPSAELADGVVQSLNVALAAAGCVVLGVLACARADPLRLAALTVHGAGLLAMVGGLGAVRLGARRPPPRASTIGGYAWQAAPSAGLFVRRTSCHSKCQSAPRASATLGNHADETSPRCSMGCRGWGDIRKRRDTYQTSY